MTNLMIGITPAAASRRATLRADRIQTAALIQIGRALAEGDDRARLLLDALETLGTISYDPGPGELDGALDDVADLARLGDAETDLTPGDVRQLFEQAARALPAVVQLPPQREAGAA